MRFWLLARLLALAAFLGFVAAGLGFALFPQDLVGVPVRREAVFWHGLALAFMATVSVLALMVFLNPRRYWPMLLPLAIGKAVSSFSSIAWLTMYPKIDALRLNAVLDGAIAVLALLLYAWARRASRVGEQS